MKSIIIRLIKGALIGSGFIVPGVSGGALAMVFGVYERIIFFLADIKKDFKENIRYFLPIAIGMALGVVFFAKIVSYLFVRLGPSISWFFVGAIVGTVPSLWKKAGKEGRSAKEYIIISISFALALLILSKGSLIFTESFSPSFLTWMACGALIALGILIPGLSSSNFIVYMGLYKTMSDGFANLDFSIIIPIGLGGLITVILLVKLIEKIYKRFYSEFFHFILGVVFASTVMIMPLSTLKEGPKVLGLNLLLLVLGILMSVSMLALEKKAGGKDV